MKDWNKASAYSGFIEYRAKLKYHICDVSVKFPSSVAVQFCPSHATIVADSCRYELTRNEFGCGFLHAMLPVGAVLFMDKNVSLLSNPEVYSIADAKMNGKLSGALM